MIPGSAGVPPAQDLAGSWRLASQGWSVHLPTGAGAAPLQECGRDARAPRGKPMAGQVQIRILQKAREKDIHEGPRRTLGLSTKGTQVQEDRKIMFPSFGLSVEHESMPDLKIPDRIEPLAEATAMRPLPVDPSGGDSRGCAGLCAGGTPALPGSHHPMRSSHHGHKIAEVFWRRLPLKEVHVSSCLFGSIRGSSSLTIGRLSSNDPHGRAGGRLTADHYSLTTKSDAFWDFQSSSG